MKQRINYNNANVWMRAQRRFVETKDLRGAATSSPLYQTGIVEKIERQIVEPNEGSGWLGRLISNPVLAV